MKRIASPFPALLIFTAIASHAQSSAGIDCTKAATSIDKTVCADTSLTQLDQKLSGLYQSALKDLAQALSAKTAQSRWIEHRNACGTASNPRNCVENSYKHRIVDLQIQSGTLAAPKTANFDCGANASHFTAAFYNDTDPASVLLSNGSDKAIAFVAMSGSGARYTAPGIEYWEHQGEAAVTWHGKKFTCKVLH